MPSDENAQPPSSKIINLNVGGTVFATSRETLCAAGDSFLSSLISKNFKVERDQNNNMFIDRDPKLFSSVLNFLRSQCTYLPSSRNSAKLQSLLAEAEFYAVVPLMEEAQRQLDELDEEDRKREAERSRQKIHKVSRPKKAMSRHSSQSSETSTETPPAAPPDIDVQREEEGDDDTEGEGMGSTPLTQGRYVERDHSGLISDAARNMDMMDF